MRVLMLLVWTDELRPTSGRRSRRIVLTSASIAQAPSTVRALCTRYRSRPCLRSRSTKNADVVLLHSIIMCIQVVNVRVLQHRTEADAFILGSIMLIGFFAVIYPCSSRLSVLPFEGLRDHEQSLPPSASVHPESRSTQGGSAVFHL